MSELPLPQVGEAVLVFVRVALPDVSSHVPVTGVAEAPKANASDVIAVRIKILMFGVMQIHDCLPPHRGREVHSEVKWEDR